MSSSVWRTFLLSGGTALLAGSPVIAQPEPVNGRFDLPTVVAAPAAPDVAGGATAASAGGRSPVIDSLWTLKLSDERIDLALARWSREIGYEFRWDADRFFPIAAPTAFEGSFEAAIRLVLMSPGIRNSVYPLEACIYANTPPLLRITRLGDQSQECR